MELCQRHQLDNGLEVLFIPAHHAPVVAIQAWIRFGAADETDEIAGLAHLFEHLLFKGTQKRGVGDIAKEVEGLGGDLNAFTTYDHTVMHVTLGKNHLGNGLDILSDSLMNSVVDATELEREKKVVIEEIKRRNDRPASRSADIMRGLLFEGHPYQRPVIGYEEVVQNMTREEILRNYKKYYNSKNIFLAIAGDIDVKAAIKEVEKYFGKMPSGEAPGERAAFKKIQKTKPVFEKYNTANTIGHFCWRGVSAKSEDAAALDALCFIIGQSESSRLIKTLVHEKALVRDIGAWSWSPKEIGSIEIDFRLAPEKNTKFSEIMRLTKECLETPFTQEELERAKKNILAGAIGSKESVDGLAQRFAYYESVTGDWANDLAFHETVKSLRLKDLEDVRKRYLNWDEVVIAGVYPEKSKKPTITLPKSKIALKAAPKVATKEGVVHKFNFNGLTVLVKPQHHVPLFSARWVGLGGLRSEPTNKGGLGNIWARSIDTGCISRDGKKLDRATINKIFDDMSAEMHAFHGRNSYGFYLDGLSEDFDRLLGVFGDIYLNPTFDEKEIVHEKKQQVLQLRSMSDNPTAILSKSFHESMFNKHCFGRSTRGEISSIKSITTADVKRYHKKQLSQPQVLSIVGDISPEQVKAALKKYFSSKKFSKSSPLSKSKLAKPPTKDLKKRQKLKKEQTHIMYGFPTWGLKSKHRHALQGLSALLSGQGGRLFLELRDKMSLCYSVGPSQMEGLDGGYFAFYIGTSPEKEKTA
ncbi:insulinase family protein, partial [bacterium]|nr:insulinase family protein [bacterium]